MWSVEFARIYSKICGDGCLSGRYVRYSNKNPDLLKEFASDVRKEFGNITLTKGATNSGTSFLQFHTKSIINEFKKLGNYKSSQIRIHKDLYQSDKEILSEFIRSFYDDEGSVCLRLYTKTKEWKRSIALSSNSRVFLHDIKYILKKIFKIKTNKIIRSHAKSSYDKTYTLTITGKGNIERYSKQINFLSKLKRKELRLIIESYGKTYHRNREGFNIIKNSLFSLREEKRKFYKGTSS
tara:strand:+ start:2458 stop:3171 length:714 start_codon:yes stop_codon:yes gene_type:complete